MKELFDPVVLAKIVVELECCYKQDTDSLIAVIEVLRFAAVLLVVPSAELFRDVESVVMAYNTAAVIIMVIVVRPDNMTELLVAGLVD